MGQLGQRILTATVKELRCWQGRKKLTFVECTDTFSKSTNKCIYPTGSVALSKHIINNGIRSGFLYHYL